MRRMNEARFEGEEARALRGYDQQTDWLASIGRNIHDRSWRNRIPREADHVKREAQNEIRKMPATSLVKEASESGAKCASRMTLHTVDRRLQQKSHEQCGIGESIVMARAFWVWPHRWAGLTIAGFLISVGVMGNPRSFDGELNLTIVHTRGTSTDEKISVWTVASVSNHQ